MNSRHVALRAALAAATFWAAKSVAIGTAGGLGKSPFEGPLYFAGLLSFVVAVVALGVAATAGARTWIRALAGAGAFIAAFLFTMAVDAAVGTFQEPDADRLWVWTEVNLWVAAAVALAIAVLLNRSSRGRPVGVGVA